MRKQGMALALAGLVVTVGAVVPATAADVTAHQVKRIAGKVAAKAIKKKAPSLSVAHARTADQATLLGGRSAADLQTTSYTYVLPQKAPSTLQVYHFPGLPLGTYVLGFNAVSVTSETHAVCVVQQGDLEVATVWAITNGVIATCSGTAPIVVGPGSDPTFEVFSQTLTNQTDVDDRSTVTFTRVDASTTASAS